MTRRATQIETGTTELLAAVDKGVLTPTMNRPEARERDDRDDDRRAGVRARRRRARSGIHCGQTADHREATRVFVATREPVFHGR